MLLVALCTHVTILWLNVKMKILFLCKYSILGNTDISQQIVYHTLKTCVKSALFSVIEHCLPEASVLPSCDLFKNGLQDRPKGCI